MPARTWLLLAASAFALAAVAGALLLFLDPDAGSAGSIFLALAFSALCLHLATRVPDVRQGCAHCGALRDLELSFCAKCGA